MRKPGKFNRRSRPGNGPRRQGDPCNPQGERVSVMESKACEAGGDALLAGTGPWTLAKNKTNEDTNERPACDECFRVRSSSRYRGVGC